jgi:hypothetical protein
MRAVTHQPLHVYALVRNTVSQVGSTGWLVPTGAVLMMTSCRLWIPRLRLPCRQTYTYKMLGALSCELKKMHRISSCHRLPAACAHVVLRQPPLPLAWAWGCRGHKHVGILVCWLLGRLLGRSLLTVILCVCVVAGHGEVVCDHVVQSVLGC